MAGCCSTALSMSAKRPSTCGRIASRSNAPAQIRASSPLLAEMQKWLDQNTTSRSVKPHSTSVARCKRASASARKVFWITLSGCGAGFAAGGAAMFGCMVSGFAAASAGLASAIWPAISVAAVFSERLRRGPGF
ncbi:hypothetical protein ACVJGC_005447 [Bradyrhizobium diazoefficiens]